MNEITVAFVVGFLFGVCVALSWAVHLVERRARRYKEAKVELVLTTDLAQKILDKCMHEALNNSGMTVMPKGKEFRWPGQR